jgi:antitoxin component YwqK of YwqJK toxin-antitoxin module
VPSIVRATIAVVRFHTLGLGLTWAAACGSGASSPTRSVAEPPTSTEIAVAEDAAIEDAPRPPRLVGGDDATPVLGPAPDPSWYCTRPDGTRHGPFLTLFPDSSIEISGTYADGLLDGAWQRHHPATGAIVEQGRYAAGLKQGTWTQASSRAAPLGEYQMTAGTGVEKRWYDDGPPYSEVGYRSGVLHGARKVYARDGGLLETARYQAGKLDGPHAFGTRATMRFEETFAQGVRRAKRTIWHQRVLVAEENYDRNGRLDGPYVSWRSTKIKRVEGAHAGGRRHGLWVWNDRAGKKEREGSYVRGKREGDWFEWADEKLVWSGSYANGRPHGTFTYLARTGAEIGKFEIQNGTGWMLTFHTNGKPSTRQRVVGGIENGPYQELTRLGKPLVEGGYRAGKKHGTWKKWTADGVLLLEQTWKAGELHGAVKKYVDGRLASEMRYVDGRAEGDYVEYRLDKPAVIGRFANDRKTGTWTHHDASGAVVRTATYVDGVLEGPYRELAGGVVIAGEMVAGRRSGAWTRTDKAGNVWPIVHGPP